MEKAEENKEVGPALVVSIHDVSPLTWRRAREILADLESAGITKVSLLVIPDHHRRGLVSGDPEFAGWLRSECARGREAVLHGHFHLRENRVGDGPWKRLVTRSYTAGEGEFFDLEKPAALDLLRRGLSNDDIGTALSLSKSTVKKYVAAILLKLEVADRAEAVAAGYERGLLHIE